MDRQELENRLLDYLYGELSDDEAKRVETALSEHPDLRDELAAHERTRKLASHVPRAEVPEGVLEGLRRGARAEATPASAGPGLLERLLAPLRSPVAPLAALVLLVGLAGSYVAFRERPSLPGAAPSGPTAQGQAREEPEQGASRRAAEREAPAEPAGAREGRAASARDARRPSEDRAGAEDEAREASGSTPSVGEQRLALADEAERLAEGASERERAADDREAREARGPRARAEPQGRAEGRAEAEAEAPKNEELAGAGRMRPTQKQIDRLKAGEREAGRASGGDAEPSAQPSEPSEARESAGKPEPARRGAAEADKAEREAHPSAERARDRAGRGADERAAREEAAEEDEPLTWDEVEQRVEEADTPSARARVYMRAHRTFVAGERYELADRTLEALADLEGYEDTAERLREALERRRDPSEAEEAAPEPDRRPVPASDQADED